MRLVDVVIWDDLGQVRMSVVGGDSFLYRGHVQDKLVIVDHTVAEDIGNALHSELIEHRQATAEYKSFDCILRVDVVIVFDVGLLRKELRSSLGGHNEFVHDLANLCIRNAVCSTSVRLKRVAGVNQEVPIVA